MDFAYVHPGQPSWAQL